jgi:hypothetical protein
MLVCTVQSINVMISYLHLLLVFVIITSFYLCCLYWLDSKMLQKLTTNVPVHTVCVSQNIATFTISAMTSSNPKTIYDTNIHVATPGNYPHCHPATGNQTAFKQLINASDIKIECRNYRIYIPSNYSALSQIKCFYWLCYVMWHLSRDLLLDSNQIAGRRGVNWKRDSLTGTAGRRPGHCLSIRRCNLQIAILDTFRSTACIDVPHCTVVISASFCLLV